MTDKMIATKSNVERALQQLSDAAVAALTPKPEPYAFGFAIGFVTTTMVLTKALFASGRLGNDTEDELQKIVDGAVSNNKLTVTNPDRRGDTAERHHGHLRNCFAHGNWKYDENDITKTAMEITLQDYFIDKETNTPTMTWAATIQAPDLVNLAEKLMCEAFKGIVK